MNKKKKRQKKRFDLEKIITDMVEAYARDLGTVSQMYHANAVHEFCQESWVASFRKKVPTGSSKDRTKAAIEKFCESNDRMAFVNANFDQILSQHSAPLYKARAWMHSVLGESVELTELFKACRFTTGASIGVLSREACLTNKVKSPISATARAARLFNSYLKYYDPQLNEVVGHLKFAITESSRGGTVPKDQKIDRFIAVEPTANVFLQKGIERMMVDRLKAFGVDLSDRQFLHRSYAFYASIHRKTATIDFSSASDRLAYRLIEFLVPQQWFEVLNIARCSRISISGKTLELSMISSMGNAFTFPLETLVFLALMIGCETSESLVDLDVKPSEYLSAYGDDCICRLSTLDQFFPLIQSLEMSVNTSKSFFTDYPFRESCGADFLYGRNVRALSVKPPHSTSLSSLEPWLYTVLNGVLQKYISYFGPLAYVYDKEFFALIAKYFEKYNLKLKIVPSHYPDDSGLKLSDTARFLYCYNFKQSRIRRDQHGTFHFNYISFMDRPVGEMNQDVHYWNALRFPKNIDIWDPPHDRTKTDPIEGERYGGYVPSKGHTPFWSFNMSVNP